MHFLRIIGEIFVYLRFWIIQCSKSNAIRMFLKIIQNFTIFFKNRTFLMWTSCCINNEAFIENERQPSITMEIKARRYWWKEQISRQLGWFLNRTNGWGDFWLFLVFLNKFSKRLSPFWKISFHSTIFQKGFSNNPEFFSQLRATCTESIIALCNDYFPYWVETKETLEFKFLFNFQIIKCTFWKFKNFHQNKEYCNFSVKNFDRKFWSFHYFSRFKIIRFWHFMKNKPN